MSEKMSEVYEAYDMEILGAVRGRGSMILKTDRGIRQISPFDGSEERLEQEREFKENLYETGFHHIDCCVPNREGELITCDRYGNPYVMREYFEGRECNSGSICDLNQAAANLAVFHIRGRELYAKEGRTYAYREPGNFRRKTQEMKKIRSFISKRPTKNDFELLYIEAYDAFYRQAIDCQAMMDACDRTNIAGHIGYCHGAYNYHSVLFCGGLLDSTVGIWRL